MLNISFKQIEKLAIYIIIVVFLTEFTSPYSLNTQQGRRTSKLKSSLALSLLKPAAPDFLPQT